MNTRWWHRAGLIGLLSAGCNDGGGPTFSDPDGPPADVGTDTGPDADVGPDTGPDAEVDGARGLNLCVLNENTLNCILGGER